MNNFGVNHAILSRFSGVHPCSGGFMAKCPAHDDGNASLSISFGNDGKTLLHCHAGCATETVCNAVGIKLADLFPKSSGESSKRDIAAIYDYSDEGGNLLYQVVRFMPKDFRQRRPDPSSVDGWNWSTKGVRRVLYRLPDIIKAVSLGAPVVIAEGEKDVAALVAAGFCATCNAGGAGKWLDEYTETLHGADVVIIPDNDEPGRSHGALVASKLNGIAKSVKTITLPVGKDAHDFFASGGTRETIIELIDAAPVEKPPKTFIEIIEERRFNPNLNPPPLRPIYSVGDIPICTPGNLQAITAHAKAGKSGFVNAILAAPMATRGSDTFRITSENPKSLAVVHFDTEQSVEDHWHQVNRSILRAGRTVLPPWVRSYCLTGFNSKGAREAVWLALERAAQEHGGIHSAHIDGVADLVADVNDPEECNELVASLHALAIQYDCPISGVIHFNPGSEKTRGHLGSQLERKSETNLRLDKDAADGVTSVWSDKQRRAPILKGEGPMFRWDDHAKMHVTVAKGESAKEIQEREEAIGLRDDVFAGRPSMRRFEMENRLQEITRKGERTARRIVTGWDKWGLIAKSVGGLWAPIG